MPLRPDAFGRAAGLLAVALLGGSASLRAAADEARFWFSLSPTDPYRYSLARPSATEPGAVDLSVVPGGVAELYLWGRPQTEVVGAPYDPAAGNPFRRLQNLSLNLSVPQSDAIACVDAVVLDNPANPNDATQERYGFVFDSDNPITINPTLSPPLRQTYPSFSENGVERFAGFTVGAPHDDTGVGPDCSPAGCDAPGPPPSWLLGTVEVRGLKLGTAPAFGWLQVGTLGITHEEETSPETLVIFGADDGPAVDSVYDANANRDQTLFGDSPDFAISVVDHWPGDFNRDGRVDAADYSRWRDAAQGGLGGPSLPPADANGDGVIDDDDRLGWAANYGLATPDAAGVSTDCHEPPQGGGSVPEPGTSALLALALLLAAWRVRRSAAVALAAVLFVAPATDARAVQLNAFWTGLSSPAWDDDMNWSTPSFPANGVDTYRVEIGMAPGGFTGVVLTSSVSIDELLINAPGASLAHSAGTLTVFAPIDIAEGELTLNPGAVLDADVAVTTGSGSLVIPGNVTLPSNTIALSGPGAAIAMNGFSSTLEFGAATTVVLSGDGANISSALNQDLLNRGVIRAETPGSRSILVNDLQNEGVIEAIGGTLTISTLNAFENSGALRTASGATLEVFPASPYAHTGGAVLQGSGTFRIDSDGDGDVDLLDTFVNDALVRPGSSPGIMTIEGNYEQSVDGGLEIEIAGAVTPGIDYDQLAVTGAATLRGRIDLPITGGFMPSVGDSATIVTAASVTGLFDRYRVSGLSPAVAQRLVYTPTDVRVDFVTPADAVYSSTAPVNVYGGVASDWGGSLPDSTSRVVIANNLGGALEQFVLVNPVPSTPIFPFRNVAHSLEVGGPTGPVSVLINGADFSISTTTEIKADGSVVLYDDAELLSDSITVAGDGRLAGTGTLSGDVTVGDGGAAIAEFDPIGGLSIDGDYTQQANGLFAAAIFGAAASDASGNDQSAVTGDVSLSGALRVDVSDLTDPEFTPGDSYDLIVAEGSLTGAFDSVEVVGRDDIYFTVDYVAEASGLAFAQGASATLQIVELTGYYMGDGNQDKKIDEADAEIFAAMLVDNRLLSYDCGVGCNAAANFRDAFDFEDTTPGSQRVVDFFDVPAFAQALATFQNMSLAQAHATIDTSIVVALERLRVPEPSGALLAVAAGSVALAGGRRRCLG